MGTSLCSQSSTGVCLMQCLLATDLADSRDDMADKELARLSKEIYGHDDTKGIKERLAVVEEGFRDSSRWVRIIGSIILACLAPIGVEMYRQNGRMSTIEGEVRGLPAKLAGQLLQQSQQA